MNANPAGMPLEGLRGLVGETGPIGGHGIDFAQVLDFDIAVTVADESLKPVDIVEVRQHDGSTQNGAAVAALRHVNSLSRASVITVIGGSL